jgi:hypothetical protein
MEEEYIDIFTNSPFLEIWSAEKETALVNLGVGEQEVTSLGVGGPAGTGRVEVVKTRDGVRVRPRSVWVENAISSCREIKTNDAVG